MKKHLLLVACLCLATSFLVPQIVKAETSVAGPINTVLETIETQTSGKTYVGTLTEIGSTDIPTSIIVRETNADGSTIDWIVEVNENTIIARYGDWFSHLEYFIPGDQIRVAGTIQDEDTIIASAVLNLSLQGTHKWTQNAFITELDCENNQITASWKENDYRADIVEGMTRIVVPPNVNATCTDLEVGDRIRARGFKHPELSILQAKVIIVLRRETIEYVKRNTIRAKGTLISKSSDELPSNVVVRVESGTDITEASDYTIRVTEQTRIRQRHGGVGQFEEWIVGDQIAFLLRRPDTDQALADDDETTTATIYEALIARNKSIGMVTTKGVAGEIVSINTTNNQFVMSWNDKNYRIDVPAEAHIVVNNENPASFDDLEVGMKVRGRGEAHRSMRIINAEIVFAWTEGFWD